MKKTLFRTLTVLLAVLVIISTSPLALAADNCDNGHSFGDWEIIREPSGLIKGERQKTCSVCGTVIKESFQNDEHKYENHTCVICGEYDPDYTGLISSVEHKYIYISNGEYDKDYCGLAKGDDGIFLVNNGIYDSDVNGLVKITEGNLMSGKWVYLVDGQMKKVNSKGDYVSLLSDTMARNNYGWWYIKNGTIDFSYTGLSENQYGIYYITEGKFNNKANGLVKITNGSIMKDKWVALVNGQYAKKSGSDIIPIYTGMAKNDYGWWYVKNGTIDFTFKGLAKNDYGWWYLKNGKLDTTFNGSAQNAYGWWYVVNGKVNTTRRGTVTINKGNFTMYNGKVSKILLNVPYVDQNPKYPTGCEAASSTMMLKYYGINITLDQMVDAIPRENLHKENGRTYGPSIYEKFVGDPTKTYTSTTPGYGAFSPVVTKSINSVLSKNGSKLKAKNITGTEAKDLYAYIGEGKPVIVWATYNMNTPVTVNAWYIKTANGDEYFSYPRGTHVMVLVGFDSDYVYVADPYSQGVVRFSKNAFTSKYNLLGKQAIVIE